MITLTRIEKDDKVAIGCLTLDKDTKFFTLQPSFDDASHYYIPAGTYKCYRHHGNKWPDTFEIIVPNSGHDELLFHVGNYLTDTHGCILLGMSHAEGNGEKSVLSSREAFTKFMCWWGTTQSFDLEIIDAYPESGVSEARSIRG